MLTNIRLRLGGPQNQRPADRLLILLLSTQLQTFYNEANLSGRPWAVEETVFTVQGGLEDYQIAQTDFGKPLQLRTYNPGDPGQIERNVDFVDLGDINFAWSFPKDLGSYGGLDGSPNTMVRIAFFRRSGAIYARSIPVPGTTATYKLLYQVGVYGETVPLDEVPMLTEHHGLLEVRTALAALPHCRWSDSKAEDAAMRAELRDTLLAEHSALARNFKVFLATMTGNTNISVRHEPVPYD